jgi:hypothetical protein
MQIPDFTSQPFLKYFKGYNIFDFLMIFFYVIHLALRIVCGKIVEFNLW